MCMYLTMFICMYLICNEEKSTDKYLKNALFHKYYLKMGFGVRSQVKALCHIMQ